MPSDSNLIAEVLNADFLDLGAGEIGERGFGSDVLFYTFDVGSSDTLIWREVRSKCAQQLYQGKDQCTRHT